MAKFTNVDYNRGYLNMIKDSNPFQENFDRAKEQAINKATQAYDTKKADFLENFFTDLRGHMMPPEGAQMVSDGKNGPQLNQGFYKLLDITPEKMLAKAKQEAKKAGLSASAIKEGDILNDRLNNLRNEASKRQWEGLARYQDTEGRAKLAQVINREDATSDGKWHTFYRNFADPWANKPGSVPHAISTNQSWNKLKEINGFKMNTAGNGITDIPWEADFGDDTQIKYGEDGRRFVETWQPFDNLMENIGGLVGVGTDNIEQQGYFGTTRNYLDRKGEK